jgi:hypothetical protein
VVRDYLEAGKDQPPDALLFTGTRGGMLRRSNFRMIKRAEDDDQAAEAKC